MSLIKRKKSSVWWIDFVAPNGERIRRSTATADRKEAAELHDKLKSEVWRVQRLGDRPKRIWQDAVVRWLREQAHKASLGDDKRMLRWLHRFLVDRELESINRTLVEAIIEAKQAEGCSNATVNRHLALLRAILRRCVRDWEWLDRAPTIRLLKEPTRRVRFLSQAQALTLLRELPPHLRDMATFALATGLTRGERNGTDLGPGQSVTQARVGPSRSGEGQEGDRRAAQRHGDERHHAPGGQASHARVLVPGRPYQAGQHEGLVPGTQARGSGRLSISRTATYLGELAHPERDAAVRSAGTRRLGDGTHGEALRPSGGGSSGRVRRKCANPWHIPAHQRTAPKLPDENALEDQ